jgi:hypothetical protein
MRYKSHVRRVLRVFKCSALACNPSFLGHRVMTSNSLPSPDSVLHRESELWGGKIWGSRTIADGACSGYRKYSSSRRNQSHSKEMYTQRKDVFRCSSLASQARLSWLRNGPCASRDGSRLLQARVCTPVEFMSPAARYTVER